MTKKMKLAAIAAISLLAAGQVNAQNTFPSTGNVGIGTTTPTALIQTSSSATTQGGHNVSLRAFSGSAAGAGTTPNTAAAITPQFQFSKARGTSAAPVGVQNGDRLGSFECRPYASGGYLSSAFFAFFVDGPTTSTSVPTSMVIRTGSQSTEIGRASCRERV